MSSFKKKPRCDPGPCELVTKNGKFGPFQSCVDCGNYPPKQTESYNNFNVANPNLPLSQQQQKQPIQPLSKRQRTVDPDHYQHAIACLKQLRQDMGNLTKGLAQVEEQLENM